MRERRKPGNTASDRATQREEAKRREREALAIEAAATARALQAILREQREPYFVSRSTIDRAIRILTSIGKPE